MLAPTRVIQRLIVPISLSFEPYIVFSSVPFSRSVMYDSLWLHESQHTRPPCPSPTPGVHSNSCPLSRWCHPAISSSVVPFSSYPQSLPASESFPMSQLISHTPISMCNTYAFFCPIQHSSPNPENLFIVASGIQHSLTKEHSKSSISFQNIPFTF